MDERNWILVTEGPAAVDDFLAATFHLGVVALDAGEIEVLVAGAAGHGAGGAAAEADQHGGSAEDDEFIAGVDGALLDVLGFDIAEAAGEHDGLVVAAQLRCGGLGAGVSGLGAGSWREGGGNFLFEGAEVAVDGGAAEFVVEGGAAKRAFDHDVEGGDDAVRFSVVLFPRLDGAGEAEIGDGEANETGFRFSTAAGGAFVADFAAGAGGGAGERRDGGGMIVRLDLAKNVNLLVVRGVFLGARVDVEAPAAGADEDGGVVFVGRKNARAVQRVGVLDHLEQRVVARGAVDVPGGVKNFVAAVLGVGLREHHQLDVIRVASEGGEGLDEVVDLVVGESETEVNIGGDQGGAAGGEDRHTVERTRWLVAEECSAGGEVTEDDLGHAVVQFGGERLVLGSGEWRKRETGGGFAEVDGEGDDAFDALDGGKPAEVGDIGGFRGPRRNRARAGRDDLHEAGDGRSGAPWAVSEEFFEDELVLGGEGGGQFGDVHELGAQRADGKTGGDQIVEQFLESERREGG